MKDWVACALVSLVALGLAIGLISGQVGSEPSGDKGSPMPAIASPGALESQGDSGPRFLFVVSGTSGRYECGRVHLTGVPFVVFFSDRPNRIAGHISVESLIDAWDEGKDSFQSDPPNAALSVFGATGSTTVVVELMRPFLVNGDLTFDAVSLQGSLPSTFGPFSVFIDELSFEGLMAALVERANRQEEEIDDVKDRLHEALEAGNDTEVTALQIELQQLMLKYSHTVNLETDSQRTISGETDEGNVRQP